MEYSGTLTLGKFTGVVGSLGIDGIDGIGEDVFGTRDSGDTGIGVDNAVSI